MAQLFDVFSGLLVSHVPALTPLSLPGGDVSWHGVVPASLQSPVWKPSRGLPEGRPLGKNSVRATWE